MALTGTLRILRLVCGTILSGGGLLLMTLMIVLPGFVMVALGTGLLTNQLLRSIRMLAALAAILICYAFGLKPPQPAAGAWLWFSLALILILYALFAVKLQQKAYQLFTSRFYLKD